MVYNCSWNLVMFHLLFGVYCEIRSTASEQLSLRHHFANILHGGNVLAIKLIQESKEHKFNSRF